MAHTRGFTLIESMITLVILALIAGFAVNGFTDMVRRNQAYALANEFYHQLSYARVMAIESRRAHTICASTDRIECDSGTDWTGKDIMIFSDANRNRTRDGKDEIKRIYQMKSKKYSMRWRSFGNKNYIQWLPSGTTNYQNGNFTFCPHDLKLEYAKIIVLNNVGRPYFGKDRDHDGIPEGSNRKNISC